MSLDHILLGLLQQPLSGYDLKAIFDSGVNCFWPAELSQIYRTLKRLENAGLLKSRLEASSKGPDRKVYSLTPAGRRTLREWLARDPEFGDERYSFLAQLFFMAELGDLQHTLSFAKQLRQARVEQLTALRRIEHEVFGESDAPPDGLTDEEFHRYLTLRSGLNTMTARIQWCDEIIKRIEDRTKMKPHGRGNKSRREK